jgi:uncharacterized protein YdhG (YjbR/CyaY superfamily)
MQSTAKTPEEYLESLPEERKAVMKKLRQTIKKNLPKGFAEGMGYGMLGYVVPLKTYAAGYHCDPKLPLGMISIASQKNFIALYHMGLYMNPGILKWFTSEYAKRSKAKLDMGKACIRFKKPELIPFELIGELAAKITVNDYIEWYERNLAASKKK